MSAPTPPIAPPRRARRKRPLGVTAVSVTAIILGIMMAIGAALLLAEGTLQGPWGNFHEFGELAFWLPAEVTASGLVLALIAGLHIAAGGALLRRFAWGWWLAMALVVAQVVRGAVDIVRGQFDQVSQAGLYAVGGLVLLLPRVRAWVGIGQAAPSAL